MPPTQISLRTSNDTGVNLGKKAIMRLNLRNKLLLAYGAVLVLTAIVSVGGISQINRVESGIEFITDTTDPIVEETDELVVTLWVSNKVIQETLGAKSLTDVESLAQEVDKLAAEFQATSENLRTLITDAEMLDKLEKASAEHTQFEQFFDLMVAAHKLELENKLAAKAQLEQYNAITSQLDEELAKFQGENALNLSNAILKAQRTTDKFLAEEDQARISKNRNDFLVIRRERDEYAAQVDNAEINALLLQLDEVLLKDGGVFDAYEQRVYNEYVADELRQQGGKSLEKAVSFLQIILEHADNLNNQAKQEANERVRTATLTMIGLSSLAAVLGVLLALGLSGSIAGAAQQMVGAAEQIAEKDLANLVAATEAMASGDLTQSVSIQTKEISFKSQDEMGDLARAFNQMIAYLRAAAQQIQQRATELAKAKETLQAAAQVAREATAIRDVDQLLDQTTRLISERFGFYHAGIFLLDEAGEYAVLRAASSQGGQRMLARAHQLKVGETGIVGHVTGSGEPRIALDVGEDAAFFDNPDLPGTRSEMALPLKVQERVIGALDVQSTEPEAFGEDDVAVLLVMADQLAIAIENARLLHATQQTVYELSSAVSEILAVTGQQAAGAGEQSAALAQTTATVDEVKLIAEQAVSRAQEVADTSQRSVEISRNGRQAVQNTINGMGRIKERVESIAENILTLSEQTQQIGDIIASVNDLAAQSNMLALNAAVEAARAGEHGKGFAVVAAEVRALAEQSKQATAQVKAILHDIQGATNSTVIATEEGTKGVDEGVLLVAQTHEVIEQLAGVIDASAQVAAQMVAGGRQQAAGVEQIALAMNSINQATVQSLASTQQAEKTAQDLSDLARSLSEIVEQYQV
jgi:methyl-accepting chemotaxis protein